MSLYRTNMDSMEFGTKVDMLVMITYLRRERKPHIPLLINDFTSLITFFFVTQNDLPLS